MAVEILLITSFALLAYTYVGYPALVYLLSRLFGREPRQSSIRPPISLIITAYNEERDIANKLENSLALDYPSDKLEIIVASDGSSDSTDSMVRRFAGRGVILHRQRERLGKTAAQNDAIRSSTGEILVFSDATTMYNRDALRKIVRSFADPEVGCVAGQLIYVDRSRSAVGQGCRSYWGYEKFLKRCESRLGSLIGVSGCIYAVRRSAYARMGHDMSSDFIVATEIHLQRLRTVYDPEAISTEDTNKRGRDEFRMRVRIIEQTMSAMHRYKKVLSLRQHPLFAFQMISHKVLRYAAPLFLIAAFASGGVMSGSKGFYWLLFTLQSSFYIAALAGWFAELVHLKLGPLSLPYYFALANVASLFGFFRFMSGEAHIVWEPSREPTAVGGRDRALGLEE